METHQEESHCFLWDTFLLAFQVRSILPLSLRWLLPLCPVPLWKRAVEGFLLENKIVLSWDSRRSPRSKGLLGSPALQKCCMDSLRWKKKIEGWGRSAVRRGKRCSSRAEAHGGSAPPTSACGTAETAKITSLSWSFSILWFWDKHRVFSPSPVLNVLLCVPYSGSRCLLSGEITSLILHTWNNCRLCCEL